MATITMSNTAMKTSRVYPDNCTLFPLGNRKAQSAAHIEKKAIEVKQAASSRNHTSIYHNQYEEPKKSRHAPADPVDDPALVKKISDYLVSLDEPWAYRMNAIWCLGAVAGCRASAMVRKGKHGYFEKDDDDFTPMFIGDILETPTKFKERIVLKERKTGKEESIILTPFVKEAIALYLNKCRKGFYLSEPMFTGRKLQYQSIEVGTVCRDMKKVKDALGITTNFTTHTMRKTFTHYSAAILMKFRQDGLDFGNNDDLDVINISTCHYDKSLTRHYAGWTSDVADAARNELSKYFESPYFIPQVDRLMELANQHKNDTKKYF